jgi:primosomal protein N' (replication factor Y)
MLRFSICENSLNIYNISISKAKAIIREVITQFQTTKLSKGSVVQPDVDRY